MMMMTRVSAININREHANTWIRTSGHWLGCDYPGCDNWFHESCLGVNLHLILKGKTMHLYVKRMTVLKTYLTTK